MCHRLRYTLCPIIFLVYLLFNTPFMQISRILFSTYVNFKKKKKTGESMIWEFRSLYKQWKPYARSIPINLYLGVLWKKKLWIIDIIVKGAPPLHSRFLNFFFFLAFLPCKFKPQTQDEKWILKIPLSIFLNAIRFNIKTNKYKNGHDSRWWAMLCPNLNVAEKPY